MIKYARYRNIKFIYKSVRNNLYYYSMTNILYNHLFIHNGILAWRHPGAKWASAITPTFTFFIFTVIITIIITIIAIITIITAFPFASLTYTCN